MATYKNPDLADTSKPLKIGDGQEGGTDLPGVGESEPADPNAEPQLPSGEGGGPGDGE